jgi:uncharacterized protein YxjI
MLFRRRRGGALAGGPAAGGLGPERRIGTRFVMRQKMFAFGDDFTVTDDQGRKVFSVDGKAFRIRHTLLFKDAEGRELYKIQEKLLRVRDSLDVKRDGEVVAHIHQALYTPLRDRFSIDLAGGDKLQAKGNLLDHEHTISRDNWPAAIVSKRWFRIRDTYGVEVAPQEDPLLMLAITVCVDVLTHKGR